MSLDCHTVIINENFPVSKNSSNEVNCTVLLVILAKMQIFKVNFQPDGRKMQKNFISKSFSKRLKKFANVGSLAEG